MSADHNARKNAGSSIVRKTIKRRGRVKRGGKPEIGSSSPTPSAPIVNPRLEYRITHTSKSTTTKSNTSTSAKQPPYVSLVIEGSMLSGSNALSAARLAVNPKVTSAIVACLEVIENELSTGESTGSESKAKASRSTGRGLKTNGKE